MAYRKAQDKSSQEQAPTNTAAQDGSSLGRSAEDGRSNALRGEQGRRDAAEGRAGAKGASIGAPGGGVPPDGAQPEFARSAPDAAAHVAAALRAATDDGTGGAIPSDASLHELGVVDSLGRRFAFRVLLDASMRRVWWEPEAGRDAWRELSAITAAIGGWCRSRGFRPLAGCIAGLAPALKSLQARTSFDCTDCNAPLSTVATRILNGVGDA